MLTREQCEEMLIEKIKEMVDIYRQYDPKAEYLDAVWMTNKHNSTVPVEYEDKAYIGVRTSINNELKLDAYIFYNEEQ